MYLYVWWLSDRVRSVRSDLQPRVVDETRTSLRRFFPVNDSETSVFGRRSESSHPRQPVVGVEHQWLRSDVTKSNYASVAAAATTTELRCLTADPCNQRLQAATIDHERCACNHRLLRQYVSQ